MFSGTKSRSFLLGWMLRARASNDHTLVMGSGPCNLTGALVDLYSLDWPATFYILKRIESLLQHIYQSVRIEYLRSKATVYILRIRTKKRDVTIPAFEDKSSSTIASIKHCNCINILGD